MAAMGASLMWGTMYIPYRKAYLSGMNPALICNRIHGWGTLGMMLLLSVGLGGGFPSPCYAVAIRSGCYLLVVPGRILLGHRRPVSTIFHQICWHWPRHPALSNTNQLWGLAWGALVFGGLAATGALHHAVIIIAGSVVMLLGTLGIRHFRGRQRRSSATRRGDSCGNAIAIRWITFVC